MSEKTTPEKIFRKLHELLKASGLRVFSGIFVEPGDVQSGPVVDVRVAQSGESYAEAGKGVTRASIAVEVSWHGYIDHRAPEFSLFTAADDLKKALKVPAAPQDCGSVLDPVPIIGQPQLTRITYTRPRDRSDYGVVTLHLTISYRS